MDEKRYKMMVRRIDLNECRDDIEHYEIMFSSDAMETLQLKMIDILEKCFVAIEGMEKTKARRGFSFRYGGRSFLLKYVSTDTSTHTVTLQYTGKISPESNVIVFNMFLGALESITGFVHDMVGTLVTCFLDGNQMEFVVHRSFAQSVYEDYEDIPF